LSWRRKASDSAFDRTTTASPGDNTVSSEDDDDDEVSFELVAVDEELNEQKQSRPIALVNSSPFSGARRAPHFQPRQPRPFGITGHRTFAFEGPRYVPGAQGRSSQYQSPSEFASTRPFGTDVGQVPAAPATNSTTSSTQQASLVQDLLRRHPRMDTLAINFQHLAGHHLNTLSMVRFSALCVAREYF